MASSIASVERRTSVTVGLGVGRDRRWTTLAPRFWLSGLLLIVGSLLIGVAGLGHPILSGDSATQLEAIAETTGWRLIHWGISFGYVLAVAGLAGLSSLHSVSPAPDAARAGAILAAFGYAVSMVGVLFMLGTAHALASAYHVGSPVEAAFVYDVLHPFARSALRVGAFAVSLALCALGWTVARGGIVRRWSGWLGVGAGLVGAVIAIALSETSPAIIAGIGLAVMWQLLVGVLLLTRRT